MTFKQRLSRYLIGVLIGLILVYAFFGTRNWLGWTPENVITRELKHSQLIIMPVAKCELSCLDMDEGYVLGFIDNGRIRFSESLTKQDPRIYVLHHKSLPGVKLTFALKDSTGTLMGVNSDNKQCNCR